MSDTYTPPRNYGRALGPTLYSPRRSVIQEAEDTASGNIVVRVGRECESDSWHQTEHVVLKPHEASDFALSVIRKLPESERAFMYSKAIAAAADAGIALNNAAIMRLVDAALAR